ncbi:MAG TPA: beta-ketoacyl-[acyl-carrier-protein] synthase family protein [Blastocatellia bacterium]|jgi:3-oxoacyl-[acyl-carrier-protein] synthase II|nr:beta-ketoacyl-[acyl-carrier-protein] synthase family protein [Blastocatellia bacterium]
MSLKRVVVTGMGAVSPNGIGREAYWKAISTGVSGTGPITLFDASKLSCKVAAEVKDFDFDRYISKKDKDRVQRAVPMAFFAAEEAAEDAGINFEALSAAERENIGVVVGTGAGGIEFAERQYRQYYDKGDHDTAYRRVSPYSIVASFVGMLSSEINMAFRLHGMSHVVSTGCTSSTDAMGYAWNAIRLGQVDTIVSGGVEACITFGLMTAFCRMGTVTTKWNEQPAHASRPFNADRDGFVLGEGAWILILEELEHARRRGANIYAEIVGYASTCDAYHRVQIAPTGHDAARAMRMALEGAGLTVDEVDYLNLHGTATKINDRTESAAVRMAFGDRARNVPASSTKSMIGHPQGASGAAGVVATLMAMKHNYAPPTINIEMSDPECDLDYVPNAGRSVRIDTALCNCIAFGSKNSALVFKKYESGEA